MIMCISPSRSWQTAFQDQLSHLLSVRCAAVSETGHKSGTVWRPISYYVACYTASAGSYGRHFLFCLLFCFGFMASL